MAAGRVSPCALYLARLVELARVHDDGEVDVVRFAYLVLELSVEHSHELILLAGHETTMEVT